MAPSLRRVINATGVILHTNLGRAPLARAAAARVADLAAGYTNLEYDLDEGNPRAARCARGATASSSDRGRGRGRREQQRGRDASRARGARHRTRSRSSPAANWSKSAAGFRVPRCARSIGCDPARGRHHQSHARGRLRGGDRRSHGAHPAGPSVELSHRGFHRTSIAR